MIKERNVNKPILVPISEGYWLCAYYHSRNEWRFYISNRPDGYLISSGYERGYEIARQLGLARDNYALTEKGIALANLLQ